MDWFRWYLLGALITLITFFRRPTSLMAVGVLVAVVLFWPIFWVLILKFGFDHAVAKLRRGDEH